MNSWTRVELVRRRPTGNTIAEARRAPRSESCSTRASWRWRPPMARGKPFAHFGRFLAEHYPELTPLGVCWRCRTSCPTSLNGVGRRFLSCSAPTFLVSLSRFLVTCPLTLTGASRSPLKTLRHVSPPMRCRSNAPAGYASGSCSTSNSTARTKCPTTGRGSRYPLASATANEWCRSTSRRSPSSIASSPPAAMGGRFHTLARDTGPVPLHSPRLATPPTSTSFRTTPRLQRRGHRSRHVAPASAPTRRRQRACRRRRGAWLDRGGRTSSPTRRSSRHPHRRE
jgi:hypothetical protein